MSHHTEYTMHRLVNEVINAKCLEVIEDIIHPEYVYRSPDQTFQGRQALRELFTAYHNALPDLHVHIDDLLCTEHKAVLVFTLTGTHKDDFMGIPATGRRVSINGMTCSRIENGQIIEEWELIDQLSLLQQLGVISLN